MEPPPKVGPEPIVIIGVISPLYMAQNKWFAWGGKVTLRKYGLCPSKIEWDLTNLPQRKLLEILDAQV